MAERVPLAEFEVGTYICPKTKAPAPLMASQSITTIQWPVTVKACARCGESHLVREQDVRHPPVFGYE